jgi:hypothetical protein
LSIRDVGYSINALDILRFVIYFFFINIMLSIYTSLCSYVVISKRH